MDRCGGHPSHYYHVFFVDIIITSNLLITRVHRFVLFFCFALQCPLQERALCRRGRQLLDGRRDGLVLLLLPHAVTEARMRRFRRRSPPRWLPGLSKARQFNHGGSGGGPAI